jgi:ubiquinone/menaquinone biosynthesis C-methylase UbiE
MDHFHRIYASRAIEYHQMIAAEDSDGQLPAALRRVAPWAGKRVLDLGTGTGRLPLLMAGEAALVVGVDLHRAMLREQQAQRARAGGHWPLAQADMRQLPFPSGWAEVVTAGWSIGHLRGWHAADWQAHIGRVLREMERVAAPSGTLVIMETMTTGSLTPAPPTAGLAEYYAWLENDWGYARHVIATDYTFGSVAEAVAQTEFFFGAELAATIRDRGWSRLPEWTGVWSKALSAR